MTNKTSKNSLSFTDTQIAFEYQKDSDLYRNYFLFRMMNQNWLVNIGTFLIKKSLQFKLPVKKIIKNTIFKLFCGGETITECEKAIKTLNTFNIGTILDYSVEGEDDEIMFESTKNEILKSIEYAGKHKNEIPFSVFKITGIGSRELLTKVQNNESLTVKESKHYDSFVHRLEEISAKAYQQKMRLFIDAEESWIQDIIDDMVLNLMRKYNKEETIIFNTYQLYKKNSLSVLRGHHEIGESENFTVGAKLVRGAYMEKERERAQKYSYEDPINPTKEITDQEFNSAVEFCIENHNTIKVCLGTHNEYSTELGTLLLNRKGLDVGNSDVYFAQLLGMSDNISFNLAKAGYNTAKYVPYGPVESVMPYLFRRAEENTSVAGQTSREYLLLKKEIERRKKL
jgi:proline dehydrogenase